MPNTIDKQMLTGDVEPLASSNGQPRPYTRLYYLDVLRGTAVILVLGHHTTASIHLHPVLDAISKAVHDMGYLGVDLFFVLSGFLIGGLLFKELDKTGTIRVRRFLVRRALKIWPAYLVCLVASCIAYAMGTELADDPNRYWKVAHDMWPAAFHVQNYASSTSRLIHFWSLGVEEHFYLLLPITLLILCRTATSSSLVLRRVFGLAVVLAVGCLVLRGEARLRQPEYDGYVHQFPTHLRIDSLVVGVLLAAATRYASATVHRIRPYRWALALAGMAFFVLPALVPGVHPKLFPILYPLDYTLGWLSATAIVLLAHFADESDSRLASKPAGNRLARRLLAPVAFIGFFSYSIYLWHFWFAPPISKRALQALGYPVQASGISTVVHLGLYFAVAILMGVLPYYFLERPFLSLRERVFPNKQVTTEKRSAPSALVGPTCPA